MYKKFDLIFLLIILLGGALRLIALDRFPTTFSVDEVSIGYNAFSILQTGKDQFQKSYPLIFESLGDFKPPLYIYLASASIRLFGLNEFAVRLPATIAGIIAILFIYLLIKELIPQARLFIYGLDIHLAHLASLALALSPWHLRLSRAAYESSVAFTLVLIGFYFLLRWYRQTSFKLLLSWVIPFALTIYTYHTPKLFIPLLLVLVLGLLIRQKSPLTKSFLLGVLLIVGTTLPMTLRSQARAAQTLVTRDPEIRLATMSSTAPSIFNQLFLGISSIPTRYIQYFEPAYLFTHGSEFTHNPQLDYGLFHLFELPLAIIGLVYLLAKKSSLFNSRVYYWLFLIWTFASPVAAAFTLNSYHMIRSFPLLLPFTFLIGLGSYVLLSRSKIFLPVIIVGYVISLLLFADYYLVHFPTQRSDDGFDPSKQVVAYALSQANNYDQIVISSAFGKSGPTLIGAPDIYLLFYGQIPPQTYWSTRTKDGFAKFHFRHIEWSLDQRLPHTLLLGSTWELPEKDIPPTQIKSKINFYNRTPAFLAVETK